MDKAIRLTELLESGAQVSGDELLSLGLDTDVLIPNEVYTPSRGDAETLAGLIRDTISLKDIFDKYIED